MESSYFGIKVKQPGPRLMGDNYNQMGLAVEENEQAVRRTSVDDGSIMRFLHLCRHAKPVKIINFGSLSFDSLRNSFRIKHAILMDLLAFCSG